MEFPALGHLTLLYVEDEERLASLMRDAIGPHFRRFFLALDAHRGIELFEKHHPDIVVTDITMPGMDGLEMARIIRNRSPQTPVVILSAYSDKEKLLSAIDTGIRKYFIKPFDPDELLEYLDELSRKETLGGRIPLAEGYLYELPTHTLYREEEPVKLTPRERTLIETLIELPGHTLDRQGIKELLWPGEHRTDDAVRVLIKRLRDKTSKELIQRKDGYGYTLAIGK